MKYPLVKLPSKAEESVYLIKQELKSRKLFRALSKAGLHDCRFQPCLDTLILRSLGVEDCSDELFQAYDAILEKRARKIEGNNESITKQAFKAYQELTMEKRRLKG